MIKRQDPMALQLNFSYAGTLLTNLLPTVSIMHSKAIAVRLEKVLPSIIHPCQTGYMKGRYIGECIRLISDTMLYIKQKNLPGAAIFLDFEKAFNTIEWIYLQKCLEVFNFGPQRRQWIRVFLVTSPAAYLITDLQVNTFP